VATRRGAVTCDNNNVFHIGKCIILSRKMLSNLVHLKYVLVGWLNAKVPGRDKLRKRALSDFSLGDKLGKVLKYPFSTEYGMGRYGWLLFWERERETDRCKVR
jgi:hypothetical protein